MKMLTVQTRLVSLLGLFVFWWTAAHAQITPLGDAYTNTADPTTNYGAKTRVARIVQATQAAACPSGGAFQYQRLCLVLARSIPPSNKESSS